MKPSIPSGMRDFSSEEVYKRQYIFNTIRNIFEKYGYQPIETPTMENLSTLEGKYGDEGNKLLFRILDSGDSNILDKLLENINWENAFKALKGKTWEESKEGVAFEKKEIGDLTFADLQLNAIERRTRITSKGLRYDLTVPFARYVVMHQNEITFPFKRYQIQPVFRADRPQKGRYREFSQCDADVVGSDSLLNEVELIQIYDEVFSKLSIPVKIKINNRKILQGIADFIGVPILNLTSVLDKFENFGATEGILGSIPIGFTQEQLNQLFDFFKPSQSSDRIRLRSNLSYELGKQGYSEIDKLLDLVGIVKLVNEVEFDLNLARGLDYYTGTILEVKANSGSLKSSLGGGGRYDDLTGIFGLKNVSGVGISFGADRIYDVMEELKLFPEATQKGTSVLFINFDEVSVNFILPVLKKIRDEGIAAEIYPSAEKLKKQMKYADDKKIPFVVFAGEEERNSNQLTIKNMNTGEQEKIAIEEIIFRLKEKLT